MILRSFFYLASFLPVKTGFKNIYNKMLFLNFLVYLYNTKEKQINFPITFFFCESDLFFGKRNFIS